MLCSKNDFFSGCLSSNMSTLVYIGSGSSGYCSIVVTEERYYLTGTFV